MEARETTPGPSREPSSPTPSKHLSSYFSLSLLFSLLLETERGSERGRDWSAGHQSTAAPCLNWAAVHLCGIISVQPAARRHYNIHRLPGRLLEGEPPFGGGIRGTKLPLQPRFLGGVCRVLLVSSCQTFSLSALQLLDYFIQWRLAVSWPLSLSFLSITVCVFGDCPHISACIWKLKLPFEFFLLARWLNVGVVRWERSAFAKLAHIERRTYCAPHRSFTRTWAQTRTLTCTCTHGCNSRHAAGSPVCAHLSFWVPLNSRA